MEKSKQSCKSNKAWLTNGTLCSKDCQLEEYDAGQGYPGPSIPTIFYHWLGLVSSNVAEDPEGAIAKCQKLTLLLATEGQDLS